jgi:hypothetical protein
MSNVAYTLNRSESSYEVGTVSSIEETRLLVQTEQGALDAARAPSCLVTPGPGDEVAVFLTGDGRAFVTAVLVRAATGAIEVGVKGDLRISADGGSCRIDATEDVEVSSDGSLSLTSKLLALRAIEGSVVLSGLTLLASTVLAHTDGVRVAARAFDWVCERLSSTVKRSYRKVEELDQLRAERIDYRTEQEICLRSENFVVGARKLAKVDAEQIHIG